MDLKNFTKHTTIVSALWVFGALSTPVQAQDGVSSAGASRTRFLGNLGKIPAPDDVIVEDLINFHRHDIGRPKAGEAIGLDVRWNRERVAAGGDLVLQIGLSTPLAHDRRELRPLNIALVIDKSGSMSSEDKMNRVKDALQTFVSKLRPTDYLSIVSFDSEAKVELSSRLAGATGETQSVIGALAPGGSTNIHGGLMLGYQEVLKHYKKGATNRVILLTDGIANRGVTEPEKIANDSVAFNDKGIDLSTIGVGLDLNKDLMRTLAKRGRGLSHFIGDRDDIDKVFVNELQSLISPVAHDIRLQVDLPAGAELLNIYGYDAQRDGNRVSFALDNLNSGATQVVLMRLKAKKAAELVARATVTYYDIQRNREQKADGRAGVSVANVREPAQEDSSVAKNFAIAILAQAMKDMSMSCAANNFTQAGKILSAAISRTERQYPDLSDPDITRTLETARKYDEVLRAENAARGNDIGEGDSADGGTDGSNLIPNGDFALGNWGFKSAYRYTPAYDNCLWEDKYTVAPQFNSPQLHRLIAREEFRAPSRPTGKEQVFFCNAGGSDKRAVISTKVNCQPRTKYRVSFSAISLTPGAEWIPTFEIRVGGDRSEAQAAGAGVYTEIVMEWESKNRTSAEFEIVRMPIPHGGGLIGICNVRMVKVN